MSAPSPSDELLYITRDDCQRVISPRDALQLAEQALRWEASGDVVYPTPRSLKLRAAEGALTYHSKVVSLSALNVLGARVVSYRVEADGRRPGADRSTRLLVLIDTDTGGTLAIVDEHYNYALRTAASVGVATQYLAGERPVLGVVGAGVVARASIDIMLEALPLEAVRIYSRTPERAQSLIDSFADSTDVPLTVCSDVDELAATSNVLVTATTAREPFVFERHLRPGMTVCALGSNELDSSVYESCDRLVVDDSAQTLQAADIASLSLKDRTMEDLIRGELPGLVVGDVPRRTGPDEVIVVRTEGLASQDVIFAHFAWKAITSERG